MYQIHDIFKKEFHNLNSFDFEILIKATVKDKNSGDFSILLYNNRLYVQGFNFYGQFGLNDQIINDFKFLSEAQKFSVTIINLYFINKKKLYGCGSNFYKQISNENKMKIRSPVLISENVDNVKCSINMFVLFSINGKLFGKGDDLSEHCGKSKNSEPVLLADKIVDFDCQLSKIYTLDTNGRMNFTKVKKTYTSFLAENVKAFCVDILYCYIVKENEIVVLNEMSSKKYYVISLKAEKIFRSDKLIFYQTKSKNILYSSIVDLQPKEIKKINWTPEKHKTFHHLLKDRICLIYWFLKKKKYIPRFICFEILKFL